ncbi:hypothetical protein UFOVP1202_57 [uncultured Caudovirales phage]|uniref:Uncharacterized protein n=1 Tax=uncultured Caudovirales phage TaxID=2100421 RepID=A0A6J5R0C8_9CAUD|nr:hypothetical protein UFOVP1202_57 [uncultured Caudovirales phage]
MAERFPLENLKVVGNNVYRVAPDGRMFFVRSLAEDPTANTDVFAAPPRADAPSFYGSTPKQGSYFGKQAIGMAAPHLQSAYDLASTATTMTPDPNNYAPEAIQRMGHAATNYGIAGLQAFMSPFYGAAGLVGDVAKAAGVPRSEALTRDLGAMLDTAGILPEGRILGAMADAGAVGQVAGNAKRAVNAAVERAPVLYADAIGNARALAQGDLEFMRGRGLPSESAAAGAQVTGRGTGAGAIIRPDDTFRGNGSFRNNVESADVPFAYRLTGQTQIDDMIQSGMVRPKEGGYGQAGQNTVHYGAMPEATPSTLANMPKTDPNKGFTLVADKTKIAGKEGPATLDDLQHIWTMRDGQMVDILDEVKAKNRDYGAAPGIGDNGGPALDNIFEDNVFETLTSATAPRQRYVDPATGMYSKSYEAAHALTQNVGTAEQMRKMLLNNGANEEELFYTGFDKWIKDKGNAKVTKDEIVNYLDEHAFNGQDVYTGMDLGPFTSKVYAGQGVLGAEGRGIESIRDNVYTDRRVQAEEQANAYRNQVTNDMVNMGYQTLPEVNTVDDLSKLEEIVKQAKDNGRYVSPSLTGRVRRAREKVDRFIANPDSTGTYAMLGLDPETALNEELAQTFYGTDRIPTGSNWFADPVPHDMMIDPQGNIHPYSFASGAATRGAENPWEMVSRLRNEADDEVNNMTDQQIADYMGIDLASLPTPFKKGDTRYSVHSPEGVKDYAETTYNYTDPHDILSGQNAELGTKDFSETHGFGKYSGDARDAGRLYHTRTGTLNTPEGPAHLLFEAQSDIAQKYDKFPDWFHITGKNPEYDIPKEKRKALQEYLKTTKEYARLEDEVTPMRKAVEKAGYRSDELARQTGMTIEEARKYLGDFTAKYSQLTAATNKMSEQRGPLFSDLYAIKRFYGLPEEFDAYNKFLKEQTYDPSILENVLAGKATITEEGAGNPKGKVATRPFTTSTNRWAPAALKNELIKAVGKDAEWFALPMGKDVKGWTNGKIEGQEGFYENILPIQLKKLIKKELGIDVQVEKIKAEGFLPKVDNRTYEVNAIRLTPEIKQLIKEKGFSTFKKGGPVEGSSLADIDVFALQ